MHTGPLQNCKNKAKGNDKTIVLPVKLKKRRTLLEWILLPDNIQFTALNYERAVAEQVIEPYNKRLVKDELFNMIRA